MRNGDYAMDIVSRMRGEDDIGEIPVNVLMKQNSGDLKVMPDIVMDIIMKFVPKDQSGFDMLFAPRPATLREVERMEPDNRWRFNATKILAMKMVVKVTEIGINETTYLRLRWLVAEGPQPVWADIAQKKRIMLSAFYILLDLIKKRGRECDLSIDTQLAIKVDVTVKLSARCWNHVNGWLH